MQTHAFASQSELLERAHEEASRAGLALVRDEAGLAITDGTLTVRGDFTHMARRAKPCIINRELLVRAAKVKKTEGKGSLPVSPPDTSVCPVDKSGGSVHADPLTAVDATAGLGEDSLLLAAAGFTVTLYERNPVIAALLQDAIERARQIPELAEPATRMTLHFGDSVQALAQLETAPDVVLLDPMFPGRSKSAAVKKKLQLLQRLEQPCEDECALMDAAFAAHPRKVVVKRPVKGPHLAGRKPDYTLAGKAIRFDCYALPR